MDTNWIEEIMEDSNSGNDMQYEDNIMIGLLVLPSECLKGILSFCDANSLCTLDLTSRAFQQHTENAFSNLAFERFGLKSANKSSEQVEGSSSAGKTVWRQGLALVQTKQHYTVTLTHPAEYVCEPNRKELAFDGLATHPTSSLILYKTDNWGGGHFDALAGSTRNGKIDVYFVLVLYFVFCHIQARNAQANSAVNFHSRNPQKSRFFEVEFYL